jgi:YjbR
MLSPEEFRRIALKMEGAIESAHMAHPDFRANGRIFATISPDLKSGMVKLSPEQQERFIDADANTFTPASGAWGRQGCTMVRLASVDEATVRDAMRLAYRNTLTKRPPRRRARP